MMGADEMTEMDKALKSIEKSFAVSKADMRKIIRDFRSEMEKGLSGEPGSLKMIPTYVDRPTGNEKGRFIALDLGGTNFRILELELKGNGRTGMPKMMKFVLEKRYLTGDGKVFFDFIAECLRIFMNRQKVSAAEERKIGFTFSFPVEQTGIASGVLVCWTKGFDAKGVVGRDVVKLLNEALRRKGMDNVKIAALANDTVGTLVAKSYEDPYCDVGIILGTGTNACYAENIANITKWHGPAPRSGRMIINIEWGNFDKLRSTAYDKALDSSSDNPGCQILEKMVSGMYLGEVVRLVLRDLVEKGLLFKAAGLAVFSDPGTIKAEDVSEVEKDNTAGLTGIKRVLKRSGVTDSALGDRIIVKKVCGLVSTRAARVSAAAIAGVVAKIDPGLSRRHAIAIDGSVYEKHPEFPGHMESALREIFAKKASRIRMALAKDGSGKGAAIIAAVAGRA